MPSLSFSLDWQVPWPLRLQSPPSSPPHQELVTIIPKYKPGHVTPCNRIRGSQILLKPKLRRLLSEALWTRAPHRPLFPRSPPAEPLLACLPTPGSVDPLYFSARQVPLVWFTLNILPKKKDSNSAPSVCLASLLPILFPTPLLGDLTSH